MTIWVLITRWGCFVAGSAHEQGAQDAGSRPARRIRTVDDVRWAIRMVERGLFGVVEPEATSGAVAVPASDRGSQDPAASIGATGPAVATQAVLQPDPALGAGPQVAGRGGESIVPDGQQAEFCTADMWQRWRSSREDLGRWQAVEAAQLAAFALARLLNRDDGAERLELFLASPTVQDGSGAAADVDMARLLEEDPRLTYRAGELLDADVLMVLSTGMSKAKRATVRREAAVAIVWFLGFYNLLDSIARGRLPFQRIERLGFRVDDALLPLDQVQALDRYLDALSPDLSMGQFEKLMRHRIRTLDPLPPDPEAPRRNRKVQLERCDDDSGILTLTGPIDVLDALYQRTRATARAIRRGELSALGLEVDGEPVAAAAFEGRRLDERTISHLMFDLLAGSRPQTQVRTRGAMDGVDATLFDGALAGGGELIDVLCPTDGTWLRKQAAVHVTVPASTLLGLDGSPGRVAGDATLSAQKCREIAAHATSWVRILTDPATGVVTDDSALTYEPTAAMRRTVRQKWRTCTAPGCSHPAESCEIDHVRSFCHLDPAAGGPTTVENLHPLCKHHHQLKTAGVIRVRKAGRDELEWVLPMGVTATAVPAPIGEPQDAVRPRELLARAHAADGTGGRRESDAARQAGGAGVRGVRDGGREPGGLRESVDAVGPSPAYAWPKDAPPPF